MTYIARTAFAAALMAVASPAVHAGVDGNCTYKDKKLHFVDGHFARAPDMFDEKALLPTLWFVTVAFDPAPLAAASPKDIDDAVTRQVFDHDSAELTLRLDADGKVVEALQLYVPP